MPLTILHPIEIYAEWFDSTFVEHVRALETSPDYRISFQDAVCVLGYLQWLNSPKWKLTAKLKRLTQPHCERCGARSHLEVHHTTYEHLGIELLYLSELSVLCSSCHAYEHGTVETAPRHQLRFSFTLPPQPHPHPSAPDSPGHRTHPPAWAERTRDRSAPRRA